MKTAKDRTFSTPMMQQYMEIKEKYRDCLLFFRLGDFYELFLDDALIGSKVLDIVLTRRPRGKDGDIPMAGVPYHSADNYIAKLVKAGHKVAICEQTSEPDKKGIVEREVIRIVTPGTLMDERSLERNRSNYVMTLKYSSQQVGLAFLDLSTGKFTVTEVEHNGDHRRIIADEVRRFLPSECILSSSQYSDRTLLKTVSEAHSVNIYDFEPWDDYAQQHQRNLKEHFKVDSLQGFGLENWKLAQQAASALLGYINHTQRLNAVHLSHIETYHPNNYVRIDDPTIRNLELFSTLRDQERSGSFINTIDKTQTAMGGRLLKEWVSKPLMDVSQINSRLEAVEVLFGNTQLSGKITKELSELTDIERLVSRLAVNLGNARDLLTLRSNLDKIVKIRALIPHNSTLLKDISVKINESTIQKLSLMIENHIADTPPRIITEGGMIKDGVSEELDSLRAILYKGSDWIKDFETSEKESTQIPTLKVKFNKVFGFYIEVSRSHTDKVPENYFRKQTTVNSERYITEELKVHEKEVLSAEERIQKIEHQIFTSLVKEVLLKVKTLQKTANAIAELDCINSFAQQALQNKYAKPLITENHSIKISQGRHPVVEEMVAKGEFVPNDTLLNETDHQLIVLTGPNMAGKSVFIRQVALLTLMAHIGMFVPADSAEICIVDRIFVRSGASDMISSGLSTFMVEMVETANILNHATPNSLIIMDEVGRGTSTYDGISIASSVVEYLVTNTDKKAKTLFATHYHELQELEDQYPESVKNYQVEVRTKGNNVIFLHSVAPGKASHSYGVAVAQKAGVPLEVTNKAIKKLYKLENRNKDMTTKEPGNSFIEKINNIDVNRISPVEALNILSELKKSISDA